MRPTQPSRLARMVLGAAAVAALGATLPSLDAQQAASGGYTVPRTPWGDPDLQGKWPGTEMVGVPMQRDERLGLRNELNDEEFAERVQRAARQEEQDNADFELENAASTPGGAVGGAVSPPPHWLERGEPQRQASLIVDPPNGRMPAFTPEAQERQAALRAYRQTRGPADSYTDRSNYDRCITRGLAGSVLPVIYNNGTQIIQSPGYVAIVNEMIHETRVVPLDGRAHVGSNIKMWLGDSRGRFEGDTLVVETTNFTDRTGVGVNGGGQRHSEALKITERYTRVADDVIDYRMTIDDPETYTAPWTMQIPLKRDDGYGMFEYACHEGNLAMFNILSGARADDRAASGRR
ncbi:MAG TPA: hypothetical protein VKA43_10880 [Gammaproteobacteria bacterium]|nr:hypothetical protein [Gammaproteobacteria bacterium]